MLLAPKYKHLTEQAKGQAKGKINAECDSAWATAVSQAAKQIAMRFKVGVEGIGMWYIGSKLRKAEDLQGNWGAYFVICTSVLLRFACCTLCLVFFLLFSVCV